MTNIYLPEARKNIVQMLDRAATAWVKTMMKEAFNEPKSAENLSLMLEAMASSLAKVVDKNPERDALLRTFALEILDQVKEEK